MKTKTAILLFAALAAAVSCCARAVNATWTNTSATAANIRIDSRTVGDATVASPVWSPWTSTTAKVEPGASYDYLAEGWSLVSKPSSQPPYYQLVEVKVYEATLTVESYDPPPVTWSWVDYDITGTWSAWSAWSDESWSPATHYTDETSSGSRTRSRTTHHYRKEVGSDGGERNIDTARDPATSTQTETENRIQTGTLTRPPANQAPAIAWADIPTAVTHGETHYARATGADADGNLTRVVVQRRVNSGTWTAYEDETVTARASHTNIGGAVAVTDAAGSTVEYRAAAYDAAGASSTWITWGPVTVVASNTAPTITWADVPATITYSGSHYAKATGSDADGNLTRVVVQRRVNSGTWTAYEDETVSARAAYTNTGRMIAVTNAAGTTIEYRAAAYDTVGASSTWITWGPVTVVASNTAPTVSITQTSPEKTYYTGDTDFAVRFTADDANGNLDRIEYELFNADTNSVVQNGTFNPASDVNKITYGWSIVLGTPTTGQGTINYQIRVRAYDSQGLASNSAAWTSTNVSIQHRYYTMQVTSRAIAPANMARWLSDSPTAVQTYTVDRKR